MRYVSMKKVEPGMIVASELYDMQGRVVIGAGSVLNEYFIKRLNDYGFGGVYITDKFSEDIQIENAIPPSLRQQGMKCLRDADIDRCKEIAKEIVEAILPNGTVSLDMADLRSYDDYTYAHSVNVAVLCCAMGMGMLLTETELEYLVTAALLHDLGKLQIDPKILNKPGRLTSEEYDIMKKHPVLSFELLSDRFDISAHIKRTVLFHHENVDGSGYPNGLTGPEQSILVKILHVADVYDALTAKRPYKKEYSPFEAAEYLMGAGGMMFDRDVVSKFIEMIPLYPKGTEVLLSDGRRAMVTENSEKHNLRPAVRILDTGEDIDLTDRENLNLTIVYEDEEDIDYQMKNEAARKEMLKEYHRSKIVVVDDMTSNLHTIRDILQERYDLALLKSGKQAIMYMKKNEAPDLILMDVDMPEMNGIEAARQIHEITGGDVPIAFVSAICDRETVLLCKEQKAMGYIAKPYQEIYLKSEIERILKGWGER